MPYALSFFKSKGFSQITQIDTQINADWQLLSAMICDLFLRNQEKDKRQK